MAIALRATGDNVIWRDTPEEYPWLVDGDIPADRITDLDTEENQLSIWIVKNKDELNRCLAAFAANRQRIKKVDYYLFKVDILDQLNLTLNKTGGKLKDIELNCLHRDVINLSANNLIALAKLIQSTCILDRKEKSTITMFLNHSIANGWIHKEHLDKTMQAELDKFLTKKGDEK